MIHGIKEQIIIDGIAVPIYYNWINDSHYGPNTLCMSIDGHKMTMWSDKAESSEWAVQSSIQSVLRNKYLELKK